jgi:hypothetical protein
VVAPEPPQVCSVLRALPRVHPPASARVIAGQARTGRGHGGQGGRVLGKEGRRTEPRQREPSPCVRLSDLQGRACCGAVPRSESRHARRARPKSPETQGPIPQARVGGSRPGQRSRRLAGRVRHCPVRRATERRDPRAPQVRRRP